MSADTAVVARQADGSYWGAAFKTGWALPGLDVHIRKGELVRLTRLEGLDPVAISFASVLGQKRDGTLWACGDNGGGQLGDGTKVSRKDLVQIGHRRDWVAFASGYDATVGMTADGKVWAWGTRLDKRPSLASRLKARLVGWFGLPWSLDPHFPASLSLGLVLQFKLPGTNTIPTSQQLPLPGR